MTSMTARKATINQSACFEQNVGQTDSTVKFIARRKNDSAYIVEGGLVLAMARRTNNEDGNMTDTVRIQFTGASQSAGYEGEHPPAGSYKLPHWQ